MWPSLETASRVSDVANIALVFSLVIGVVATMLIVWMGGVKEAHWDSDRRHSRELIAGLDAGVAEANARAAEANERAESERLGRIKIEAGLASRRLTTEQRSRLSDALASIRGRLPVVLVAVLGDKEAQDFGKAIGATIKSAGIQVQLTGIGVMSPPPYGIQIADGPDGLLTAAFGTAGIDTTSVSSLPVPGGNVPAILVGLKPPPF
jgi:hypothetical protein